MREDSTVVDDHGVVSEVRSKETKGKQIVLWSGGRAVSRGAGFGLMVGNWQMMRRGNNVAYNAGQNERKSSIGSWRG